LELPLAHPAPFSSDVKSTLLVYKDDLNKVDWWKNVEPAVLDCWIDAMRRIVEANGVTRFVLMVAPDKLTAYGELVGDPRLTEASSLANLSERHPDVMPRLDRELAASVRRGEMDIYLPNNTHWGSSGHRIAAETLLRFLTFSQADRDLRN